MVKFNFTFSKDDLELERGDVSDLDNILKGDSPEVINTLVKTKRSK